MIETGNAEPNRFEHSLFENSILVSDFEIRISNFYCYFGTAITNDDRLGCH